MAMEALQIVKVGLLEQRTATLNDVSTDYVEQLLMRVDASEVDAGSEPAAIELPFFGEHRHEGCPPKTLYKASIAASVAGRCIVEDGWPKRVVEAAADGMPAPDARSRRDRAIVSLTLLSGGVSLARAVNPGTQRGRARNWEMAHHKRKRTKSGRAGCLLCKPHKCNGVKGQFCSQTNQEKRSRIDFREQLNESGAL